MQNLYVWLAPALLAVIELLFMASAGLLILRSQRRRSQLQAGKSVAREHTSTFRFLERHFNLIAGRKRFAVFAIGFGVLAVRVVLIPLLGIPEPRFHDEFSYLLAGDTFAHGHLTNPTHPLWTHFESFHIIEHPTYMSMYPPAQGLVLAAGQVLNRPWIGQLFITAAMCSALCWMLQAWFPARWALLGAVLAALRLGILSYWMNTYWCASVAALGGALVLGAWPRLRKRPSAGTAVLLGVGLIILANSRPYEGFVFSLPVAGFMLAWLVGRQRPLWSQSLSRVVFPISAVLLVGAMATGYYYSRVTGSPFVMTYTANRQQYAAAPYFIWQTPRPEPVYHHAVMRDYYRWEFKEFERNLTWTGYIERGLQKLAGWWQYYLGPLLTVPLLTLPWLVRRRRMLLPLLLCGAMVAAFAVQTWTFPHYFSPATGALYILLVEGLRCLWTWGRSRRLGQSIVRAVAVIACTMIILRVGAVAGHVQIEPAWPRGNLERSSVAIQLRELPGQHLVIVRYGAHHDKDLEWVWNHASIDDAKVVWARDMGESGNQELLQYFKNRQVWQINADDPSPKLEAYGMRP
jgi:hypothetical protein